MDHNGNGSSHKIEIGIHSKTKQVCFAKPGKSNILPLGPFNPTLVITRNKIYESW